VGFLTYFALSSKPKLNLLLPGYSPLLQQPQLEQWEALVILEGQLLEHRYHQVSILVVSRLWMQYVGFTTGMILAMTGAAFVLGKLQELPTELKADTSAIKLSIQSTSPGIILATLGVVLMILTITVNRKLEVNDDAVYIRYNIPTVISTTTVKSTSILAPTRTPPPTLTPEAKGAK
jgi:cytochrome c biogenesis factor